MARHRVLRSGTSLLDLTYLRASPGVGGTTGQITSTVDNLRPDRSVSYGYDRVARLTQVTGGVHGAPPDWQQVYQYDRQGNRSAAASSGTGPDGGPVPTDGIAGLTFGSLRLDGLRRINNRITTAGFVHDEAGNLVRGQRRDGIWHRYGYDAAGRLTSVTDDAGTPLASFFYGACRQRLRTRDLPAGTDLGHVWHGESVVAEYDLAPATIPRSVGSQVYAGDRLLCTYTTDEPDTRGEARREVLHYHHPDHLGTRLVTTPSTGDSAEVTTLPYGTPLTGSLPADVERSYTTYPSNDTTGLAYAVNRFYDLDTGRYLQTDPLGLSALQAGRQKTHNSYAYVLGDPVNSIDPTGLICFDSTRGMVVAPMDFDPTTGTLSEAGPRAEYWWTERTCIPTPDPDEFARRGKRRDDPRRGVDFDNRGAELARALFTGPPRPTTGLDLLFGGYFLGAMGLAVGGVAALGIGADAVLTGLYAKAVEGTATLVRVGVPTGTALAKSDTAHRAAAIVGNTLNEGFPFLIRGGDGVVRTLVQVPGVVNDVAGRFEWILQDLVFITHQMFVRGGGINGIPIQP